MPRTVVAKTQKEQINIFCTGDLKAVKALFNGSENKINLPAGSTPLHYAVWNKNSEVMRFLLEEQSQFLPDTEDSFRNTPLQRAATEGSVKVICLLIEHGADPYKLNRLGQDTLEILLACHHSELIPAVKAAIEKAPKMLPASSSSSEALSTTTQRRHTTPDITEPDTQDQNDTKATPKTPSSLPILSGIFGFFRNIIFDLTNTESVPSVQNEIDNESASLLTKTKLKTD